MQQTYQTSTPKPLLNALILDDDEADIILLKRHLSKLEDYEVTSFAANSADEALRLFETNEIDVIFSDYQLSDRTSLGFIEATGGRLAGAPVIMISGMPARLVRREGFPAGASAYLSKDELSPSLIETAIETARFSTEIEETLMRDVKAHNSDEENNQRVLELCSIIHEFVQTVEDGFSTTTKMPRDLKAQIKELREFIAFYEKTPTTNIEQPTLEDVDEAADRMSKVLFNMCYYFLHDTKEDVGLSKQENVVNDTLYLTVFTNQDLRQSDTSLGLDVMLSNAERLGGTMELKKYPKGTALCFLIPLGED